MELWKGQALAVAQGKRTPIECLLPVEVPVSVYLNGQHLSTLMALPGQERELAIGFCLGTGVVGSFHDIYLVQYCREESATDAGTVVRVEARGEAVRPKARGASLVLPGCGGMEIGSFEAALPRLEVPRAPLVEASRLQEMALRLRRESSLYRKAGAVHVAALFGKDGSLRGWAEDIGRHNAADKAIGSALLRGYGLDDAILMTTGRASHEFVVKARYLGIPLVAVLSAPTSLAIELAADGRCTLAGRFRSDSFIVYTWDERIG